MAQNGLFYKKIRVFFCKTETAEEVDFIEQSLSYGYVKVEGIENEKDDKTRTISFFSQKNQQNVI